MASDVEDAPFFHDMSPTTAIGVNIALTSSTDAPTTDGALLPSQLLCDWTRRVYDCRDIEFIQRIILSAALLYCLLLVFGLWLLWYRNGGFRRSMITNVLTIIGNRIYPQPLDATVFLFTVACLMRVATNILQLLDASLWLFLIFDHLYWTMVCLVVSFYAIGAVNYVPMTELKGLFAVYRPEPMDGGITHPPVYILHTTYNQKLAFLITVTLCPDVLSLCCGVAEGILEAQGHEHAASVLQITELCTWSAIHYMNSIIAVYYGYKLSIVLRYHIIATETKLGLPVRGFGIRDLNSESSARYLYIMIQISAFGASAYYFIAGCVTAVVASSMDDLRRAKDESLPHLSAVLWIYAHSAAISVKLTLVTFYFRRNKKTGVLDISSNTSSLEGDVTSSVVVELDNLADDESTMDLMLYDVATGNGGGSCSCEHMSSGKSCGDHWVAKEQQDISSLTQPKPAAQGGSIGRSSSTDVISQKDPQDRISPPQKAGTCSSCIQSSELLEPRAPHISLERARQVQEFLTLKQRRRTALRFIERLQSFKQVKQRSSSILQQFKVFMRQLQALHTQLRQLQQYYFECCDYKAQTNDAAATTDDVRRESDMLEGNGVFMP